MAKRLPSGKVVERPDRERQEDVLRTATEARQRVLGVAPSDTRRPEAGSAVGRLKLTGVISQDQYEAAKTYESVYRGYERAILVRRPSSPGNFDKVPGFDAGDGTDERYVEQCTAARRNYGDARRALLDADPLAQMAVNTWVVEDVPLYHCVGELRVGLNALARLFRVDEYRRAS